MFRANTTFHVLYTQSIILTHKFYEKFGADIVELGDDKVVVKMGDLDLHFILASSEPFQEYSYIAKKNDYGNGVLFLHWCKQS